MQENQGVWKLLKVYKLLCKMKIVWKSMCAYDKIYVEFLLRKK